MKMARIVTTAYRYKRPPKKRPAQAAQIAAPSIVTTEKPGSRQQAEQPDDPAEAARIRAWLERAKWGRS